MLVLLDSIDARMSRIEGIVDQIVQRLLTSMEGRMTGLDQLYPVVGDGPCAVPVGSLK